MERRFKDHPGLAAEIVDRFRAIEWQHLPALELGFKRGFTYTSHGVVEFDEELDLRGTAPFVQITAITEE